jgi:hypothetical protein
MKLSYLRRLLLILLLFLVSLPASIAHAEVDTNVTTLFTYQGSLFEQDEPVTGFYDLQFSLFDALTAGNALGNPVEHIAVSVKGGVFTVGLDFGAAFNGQSRFLELAVRVTGSEETYTTLAPRQPLTVVPYALYALNSPPGAQGPAGPQGEQGNKGDKGDTGNQGIEGPLPVPQVPQGSKVPSVRKATRVTLETKGLPVLLDHKVPKVKKATQA